jgi:hypothetical protein
MEVVLPNGEVMRTGMGALPGNNTWQLFPYGFGPYSDGIFTQSNFGIVTKMGVWLMPPPAGFQVFLFTFPREEDLHALVETIRPLRIANVIANVPHVRHAVQECAVHQPKRDWGLDVKKAISEEVLDKMTEKLWMGKCRWLYYGCVYVPDLFDGSTDGRDRRACVMLSSMPSKRPSSRSPVPRFASSFRF